jgi:signal transduction histidine kinase
LAPTDVREATREMTEEYRAQAEQAGLSMELEVPDELSIIESDPTRVRQVVSNLVSNAIKYNQEGGRVLVRVVEEEASDAAGSHGWVRVEIEDTGPGIPAEKQQLLFQEFSRIDPGDKKGAGIGLAMVQKVAQALDGRITLNSEPGRGSTFMLRLPLRRVGERREAPRPN